RGLRTLASYLDLEPGALMKMIRDNDQERYVIMADELDDRVAQEIQKLKLPGFGLEAIFRRVYPMGSIAAHVLGIVGKDESGVGQKGLEGLELAENRLLAGKNGRKRTLKTAAGKPMGVADEDFVSPEHGQHILLTIDASIQSVAEKELAGACE